MEAGTDNYLVPKAMGYVYEDTMTTDLTRLAEELAEEYASNLDDEYAGPEIGFIAGFKACHERMKAEALGYLQLIDAQAELINGQIDRYKELEAEIERMGAELNTAEACARGSADLVQLRGTETERLQAKLAIYEDAAIAREALKAGEDK